MQLHVVVRESLSETFGRYRNMLNLPRAKHGYNVRECFRVEEGNVFITLDFSSCEVKVLAALCQDPLMVKACREGLDFHSFTAGLLNGIPYEEFKDMVEDKTHPRHKWAKEQRQSAKAITFGILYGSSAAGIAFQAGISKDEAERLIALYFTTYPKVKEFIDRCHYEAKENFFVYSPFGQRKMEFGAKEVFKSTPVYNASLRNAQNVQIQGPASTLGLMAFHRVMTNIIPLGGKVIATVYDSIEIEAPRSAVAEIIEQCFYSMDDWPQEQYSWLNFPIGADAEIGFNWGNLAGVYRGITQEEVDNILDDLSAA